MNTDPRRPDADAVTRQPNATPIGAPLKKAASWRLLMVLGVASVISGDFAGWNFGLVEGGWGGMLIATLLMAVMYFTVVFSLAELAAAMPVAGGGYEFARRALSEWGGFITGVSILIEYAIAPAAIATFISAYVQSLTGFGGWPVALSCYVIFVGCHLAGVGEALKLMLVITAVAAVALIVFYVAMAPKFAVSNLFDVVPAQESHALGASRFLPNGISGAWQAIPFALWFFLAVEGVALAGEESANPGRDLPRGLIGAMTLLFGFAMATLLLTPGGAGASDVGPSGDPLLTALASPNAYGGTNAVYWFVNVAGLAGLVASFFAIIYGYSRLTFALARAGYLPAFLKRTNRRGAPIWALVIPGGIGMGLSFVIAGQWLMLVAVFGATVSYALMMLSHIRLRLREPDLARPYRTPGGIWVSGTGLLLACVATVAGLLAHPLVVAATVGVYVLAALWFALLRFRTASRASHLI